MVIEIKIRKLIIVTWSANHIFFCMFFLYSFLYRDTWQLDSDDQCDTMFHQERDSNSGFLLLMGALRVEDISECGTMDRIRKPVAKIETSHFRMLLMLFVEDGNLKVLDGGGSFENPIDTFLPGMKMNENLVLTSWTSNVDPATGNFTFQEDQEGTNQFVIWKRLVRYWKSEVSGNFISSDEMVQSDREEKDCNAQRLNDSSHGIFQRQFIREEKDCNAQRLNDSSHGIFQWQFIRLVVLQSSLHICLTMASPVLYMASNFTSTWVHNDSVPHLTSSLYNATRLKVWSLIWSDPRDGCSVYNTCGNFGSCNSENGLVCKCSPGFKPSSLDNWNNGDYSARCVRKSTICGNNAVSDTFLSLKMMKVGNPDSQFSAKSEMECKIECFNNFQCHAYLYKEVEKEGVGVIVLHAGFGKRMLAIFKRSMTSEQGHEEFMNELKLIAELQHTNLVRLLGCCIEDEEMVLIYEYMPNRSLGKLLTSHLISFVHSTSCFVQSDPAVKTKLDWGKRFRIIEGVAQGVLYIHKFSGLRIIHRD
ncbi:hypothetical protein DVH24_032265 [Malus domestica]|uniref:Protein kinase domain-containing protein n=1 Tax=Malus domestica TaxID=3750 RepID=A0A498J2X2_MALDO|nr:hypothetical protein DVH24_032265 [Malus domestica]